MSQIVLEASRVATAKMLDLYARMGIKVTPEMTLAPGFAAAGLQAVRVLVKPHRFSIARYALRASMRWVFTCWSWSSGI
jgi:hypothetical protein